MSQSAHTDFQMALIEEHRTNDGHFVPAVCGQEGLGPSTDLATLTVMVRTDQKDDWFKSTFSGTGMHAYTRVTALHLNLEVLCLGYFVCNPISSSARFSSSPFFFYHN